MKTRRPLSLIVAVWCATVAGQQPTIRSSTDLVRVDVQVVDRDGHPIAGLTPDQFEVQMGGRRHQVLLAELVRTDARTMTTDGRVTPAPAGPVAGSVATTAPAEARRQTFMIAIDAQTFSPGVSRGLATTAQQFVTALSPDDIVGLYTYPLGPKLEPTTDHAAVAKALDQVSGQLDAASRSQCDIRFSDMIDWYAVPGDRLAIERSYNCPGVIFPVEIETRTTLLEAQLHANLGRLRDLIAGMATLAGRKTLVLVSAGMPTTDRPGGRPDIGHVAIDVGEAAARANVSLYTLFVDNSVLERFSAERRQGQRSQRSQTNLARDTDVAERWLDLFSGAAGGTLSKVLTGNGEQAFSRIVRETSAYYLLGIDVADADRTGRALPIKVTVRQKGATVRHRAWVVVPKGAAP